MNLVSLKYSILRPLLVVALLAPSVAATAKPPEQFDKRVAALLNKFGVPGASVAIVENGRTTLARGYGVRGLQDSERVDADTIFPLGSTTKAFTAAALAILVDEDRIGWDDRVIDHMPDFRMYDPWVTRELTIRDLLVHRSGLATGQGDLLFAPVSNLSRAETVRRLQYIKPASSFRSGYAYDNLLYMVAGQLIERVTGQSWEQFVLQRILRPAGMKDSTVDNGGRLAVDNRARPHARLDGIIRGVGNQTPLDESRPLGDNIGPAGSIAASANDMAGWLSVQLGHGLSRGGDARLYSDAQALQMWKPVMLMPIPPDYPPGLRPLKATFAAYALGWSVRDYRGTTIITHNGAVLGSLALVTLIPDRNIAFSIAINSEDDTLLRGLNDELLDHYLGLPPGNWPEKLDAQNKADLKGALTILQSPEARPVNAGPSLALEQYAGSYNDPWFGTIVVKPVEGKLTVEFPHWPGISAELEHWQYDSFRVRFSDRSIEPAYMTFQLAADGKVERITMRPVSPLADPSFDYQDLLFTPVHQVADSK